MKVKQRTKFLVPVFLHAWVVGTTGSVLFGVTKLLTLDRRLTSSIDSKEVGRFSSVKICKQIDFKCLFLFFKRDFFWVAEINRLRSIQSCKLRTRFILYLLTFTDIDEKINFLVFTHSVLTWLERRFIFVA